MAHQCLLCPFRTRLETCFSKHLIGKHKHDAGFIVKCGYCETTYVKYDSFRKHMYRKHKEELTVETDVPDNDSDLESLSENEFDHVDEEVNTITGQYASYILQLQTCRNLSQTALDDVVSNTRELVSNINAVNYQKVLQHLQSVGVNTDNVDLEGIFTSNPFSGLETKAQQEKYFESKMRYIRPEQVQIGTKYVVKMTQTNKRVLSRQRQCVVTSFPFGNH